MTSPPDREILAYGAAAQYDPPPSWWSRLRAELRIAYHAADDRIRWKLGDVSSLDYRNYQQASTINRGDQAIVDAVLAKLGERQGNLAFRRTNWQDLGEVPPSSSMVAICGGGYLFIDKKAQLAKRLVDDLDVFRSVTTPVVMFGVGVNQLLQSASCETPHMDAAAAKLLSALLERVDLISVRDWTTQHILQELTDKTVHMVADPALFLAPPRAAARPQRDGLRIGINFPFHGPTSTQHLRHNLARYVALLQRLRQAFECSFVYMVHFDTEKLVAQLLKDSGLPISVVEGSPAELVAAYGELDLHLGGMLHSCILSTSAGTPCIGLAYDVKHPSFFEVMELPNHCISAVDVDIEQIFDAVRVALDTLLPLREKILARRLVLERTFDDFVDQALALVPAVPTKTL
jgi:polysaccharide pyruvyl transferase WcaK-like protein